MAYFTFEKIMDAVNPYSKDLRSREEVIHKPIKGENIGEISHTSPNMFSRIDVVPKESILEKEESSTNEREPTMDPGSMASSHEKVSYHQLKKEWDDIKKDLDSKESLERFWRKYEVVLSKMENTMLHKEISFQRERMESRVEDGTGV